MELGLTTAVYIAAAVLFILSLGGLSGQESAKRAVWYGIFGMAFAIVATLVGPGNGLWWLSLGLIVAGGLIGYALASKVEIFDNSFPRSFIFALNILVTIINTVYNLSNNYLYKA